MKIKKNISCIFTIMFIHNFASTIFAFDFMHYKKILNNYVHTDKTISGIRLNAVDYEALVIEANNPTSDYSLLLEKLNRFNPSTIAEKNSKIAFWINVYNIACIKMILDHYPVDSIRDMKVNIFRNPWRKDIIKINRKYYDLNQIEHEILLGTFHEKKIHFGIVCASVSCPDLSREVYTGGMLMKQLDDQAQAFLNNDKKGLKIDRKNKKVYVSQIFKFDNKNFSNGRSDIIPFILPFINDQDDKEFLNKVDYEIEFLPYNWDLNTLKSVK